MADREAQYGRAAVRADEFSSSGPMWRWTRGPADEGPVTEWGPIEWALRFLPTEQEHALTAAEAGFETASCPYSAEEPCGDCLDRQWRELVAAYRQPVPWWDQSDTGVDADSPWVIGHASARDSNRCSILSGPPLTEDERIARDG